MENNALNKQSKELEALARELASGVKGSGEPPHKILQSRHDCIVIRSAPRNGQTMIIKLWKRPGLRGVLRRVTQTGNIDREWKTLKHLSQLGFRVPDAIARFHFDTPVNGYTDAIVMQDFGVGTGGTEHLTWLLAQNAQNERIKFEDNVIKLTKSILNAGVLDLDHHLVNVLVTPSLDVVRLDFEIATIAHFPSLHRSKRASMIANLMTSYIVAANADGKGTANAFALKLATQLNLSAHVLRRAKIILRKNLEAQQKSSGLDLQWTPPW